LTINLLIQFDFWFSFANSKRVTAEWWPPRMTKHLFFPFWTSTFWICHTVNFIFFILQRRGISISITIQCFLILQRIVTFIFVYELFNFWNMFNLTVLIYFGPSFSLNASQRSKSWKSHFLFQYAQCAQFFSSPLNSKICRWYKSYHIFKFSNSFFLKLDQNILKSELLKFWK